MSYFGFFLAVALLFIFFAPASCEKGDKNIAMAIVSYIEAKSK